MLTFVQMRHMRSYFDPMMALHEKVFSGGVNLCSKFRGNPSNSCRDVLLKITNANIMVALDEKSGDHQGSSSGHHECSQKISWENFFLDGMLIVFPFT